MKNTAPPATPVAKKGGTTMSGLLKRGERKQGSSNYGVSQNRELQKLPLMKGWSVIFIFLIIIWKSFLLYNIEHPAISPTRSLEHPAISPTLCLEHLSISPTLFGIKHLWLPSTSIFFWSWIKSISLGHFTIATLLRWVALDGERTTLGHFNLTKRCQGGR